MGKKIDLYSLALTITLHILLLLVLWLVVLRSPAQSGESGLPVLLGDMGNLETDYHYSEIESMPVPLISANPVQSQIEAPSIITQSYEESVSITSGQESEVQKDNVESDLQPTQAEIKEQAEQRAAAEAQQMMNVFSHGQTSSQTSQTEVNQAGIPGSTEGNSQAGKILGVGGYGTFDLNGRSIEGDGLPEPAYNVQDEGSVVVTITVDPKGNVIATSINKRTNTINFSLRTSAEEAAKKTKFNAIDGVNNQTGTIIYYFKLR